MPAEELLGAHSVCQCYPKLIKISQPISTINFNDGVNG